LPRVRRLLPVAVAAVSLLTAVPASAASRAPSPVVQTQAVVSDRGQDRIRVYRIDPRGAAAGAHVLRDVTDPGAARVFPESAVDEQRTAYGLAAGRDPVTGIRWVTVTRRHETRVALLRLVDEPGGKVGTAPLATVDLPSSFRLPNGVSWSPCEEPGEGPQLEGSVLDGRVLHTAQEDVGIWRIPLSPAGFGRPELVDRVRSYGVPSRWDDVAEECVPDGADPGFGGKWLEADAEGLAVGHGKLFAPPGRRRRRDHGLRLPPARGRHPPLRNFPLPCISPARSRVQGRTEGRVCGLKSSWRSGWTGCCATPPS
jgi:3-phytase